MLMWVIALTSPLCLAGYEPYDTPYYGRNLALAIIICFFTLIVFIVVVNLMGYLLGLGTSRPRGPPQMRTAQIWVGPCDWLLLPSVDAETVQNGLFGFITQNQLNQTAATVMVHHDGCSSDMYIGWQWRNFFISAVFRHFVGQALRNVCCADVSRRHFLNKIAIVLTFS